MPATLTAEKMSQAAINDYPKEHHHVRWGFAGSIVFHVLLVLTVLFLAYLFRVKSLRDLMAGTVIPPPPAPQIEIILDDIDKIPPPPTDHPEFIIQKLIKPPPPPPPKPIIKPKPKPVPPRPKKAQPVIAPRHAPAPSNSRAPTLQVGTTNFPHPNYPEAAQISRIQGTVTLQIEFDGSGGVASCEVISSSGSGLLDNAARHFIVENWHDPAFAGKTESVPIQFQLQ